MCRKFKAAGMFIIAVFLLGTFVGQAQPAPLASWSFHDPTNWTSDHGNAPVSFTNLDYSFLGDGSSLVVDTNVPAWLQYSVVETNGATNLTVNTGTVMFWFAPNWSSTNQDGFEPGVAGRLLEVGSYTPDSSCGWWSLYVDEAGENIFFAAQTNDFSSNAVSYLSAPISWTTNYFHHVALTYSPTNTALYLDGELATNGLPLTVYPGGAALTNGFFIGSDRDGLNQAHGLFNRLKTFAEPLEADAIQQIFSDEYHRYIISPLNRAMFRLTLAETFTNWLSQPSSSPSSFNVISGAGFLQSFGDSGNCVMSSNVWLTNVSASVVSQPMTFNFSIAGGFFGGWYDVFATPALAASFTNGVWTWLGQGVTCSRYAIPNLPTSGAVLFLLGTPLDSDGDGLTDAYEKLVSHSNPNIPDTDGNGMPDGWQVLHFGGIGTNPNSDPDQDGLTNFKEYLYGTEPQVSEGMAVWVGPAN